MISDDSRENSNESDDHALPAASINQQKRISKKRKRGNRRGDEERKRGKSVNQLGNLKVDQNRQTGVFDATRAQEAIPPTLASLLAPNPNATLMLDPTFYYAESERLRNWMHLTRNPGLMPPQMIDPFGLGVAGLAPLTISHQSVLPGLPYYSGGGALLSNPSSFADVLNLAMASVQPLPLDAGLRQDMTFAAQRSGWASMPYVPPNVMEQTRRFFEAPMMALEERERNDVLSASSRQEASQSSGQSILAKLANAQQLTAPSRAPSKRVILGISEDETKLNEQQVFLRRQIEVFRATEDDILSHTRGRNNPIMLGQVGIRCRYCGHLPVSKRRKGSTYFPSSLMGIYQAAQNFAVEHLFSDICPELPPEVRDLASMYANKKAAASAAGKPYWAEAGRKLGLVDTEFGIRFSEDIDRVSA